MKSLEKEFYNLKEIENIIDLKYRQIQIRFKIIKKKFAGRNDLIVKKSNVWKIHSSLLKEFDRKRKSIDYVLFATISSKNNYSLASWKFIIIELNKTLKNTDNNTRIKYVIEKNSHGILHLHFMTTFRKSRELKNIIASNIFTGKNNEMNTNVKFIYEVKGLNNYFKKQQKPVLLK